MQMARPAGRVAYEPNSLDPRGPREAGARGFASFAGENASGKGRVRADTFADHYSQARLFFRSQTAIEQAHIASALVFELSKVEHPHIREAMVGHLRNVDAALARRVADGLGLPKLPDAPAPAAKIRDNAPSPALQIVGKMKPTLEGRSVAILVADGSDAAAIKRLSKAAKDAGAAVKIVAPKIGGAKLGDGSMIAADGQLAGTPSVMFDAVAVILSKAAAAELSRDGAAVDFVRDAFGHLKAIAADAGARALLQVAGIADDEGVVEAADTKRFIAAAKTRQWAREPSVRTLA